MKKGGWGPWLYLAPALFFLVLYLVYPTINTIRLSLYSRKSDEFIGIDNYISVFTDPVMLMAIRNNLIWLVVFTTFTVLLGLLFAVMFDRVRYEAVSKSIIFLPMSISFVGAGVIWKFVYAFRPPQVPQIGLLNAFMMGLKALATDPVWNAALTSLFAVSLVGSLIMLAMILFKRNQRLVFPLVLTLGLGLICLFILNQADFTPQGWLILRPWINNFSLNAAGIWIWTGFCMVILSAAYKGIPQEIKEAALIDGATEWQSFWHVTMPMMKTTIAVVATTMVITVLKVFDIVYVMTGGQFGTDVIANRMWKEMFINQNFGRASAIAVILMAAVIPVMIVNIKRFREQEATR